MEQGKDQDAHTAYHERQLDEFRNARAYPEIATAAALEYCAQTGTPAPAWLVERAAPLLCELLKLQRPPKAGRNGTPVSRLRQRLVHLDRWFAVRAVRDIRTRVRRDAQIFREMRGRFKGKQGRLARDHLSNRKSWLRYGTFSCASMYLSGSDAYAGPDAVRRSYRIIESINAGGEENQSCVFELSFLEKIGALPSDGSSGKKLLHLFDLEP